MGKRSRHKLRHQHKSIHSNVKNTHDQHSTTRLNQSNNTSNHDIIDLTQSYLYPLTHTQLHQLCTTQFFTHSNRTQQWCNILHIDTRMIKAIEWDVGQYHNNTYTTQIDKDVPRSFHHLCAHHRDGHIESLQYKLLLLLNHMFNQHPGWHYVQGYHDIVSVVLIAVKDFDLAYYIVEKMTETRLIDYLRTTLDCVVDTHLALIYPLLKLIDSELYQSITRTGLESHFSLSYILTLFSHNLTDIHIITQLYDYILLSHPSIHIYLFVALLVSRRGDLLQCTELTEVHTYFQALQAGDIDLYYIIQLSYQYYIMYPPDILANYSHIKFYDTSPLLQPAHVTATQSLLYRAQYKLQQPSIRRTLLAAAIPTISVLLYAVNTYMSTHVIQGQR